MTDSRKTGNPSTVDEHQRLQDLILGQEKDRLHKLDRRVTDLELRTADVAEVLPGAMSRLVDDPASKPDFEQPIVSAIRGAIKRDTQSFAEALFPVLGPAIRRAVADALQSLVQRINVALEHSFTVKGMRWRMEAARSGVPFAQIVLSHTMLYAVQEAFLIQRKSGLVLASVHRDEALALDEDAVSAMLTAIQAFIQDSFGVPTEEPLRSAELGDRTLWVINGPEAVLACVISGSPPRAVRDELMDLLETMHARFGDRFNEHPEVLHNNAGLNALMLETLREEADQEKGGSPAERFRWLWTLAGVAAVGYLLWAGWSSFRDQRLEDRVTDLFDDVPGYVITDHDVRDGRVHLAGLRDPLAAEPAEILQGGSVPPEQVEPSFRPYQSLEAEILQRRLRSSMGLDEGVAVGIEGPVLTVSGQLTSSQYGRLEALPGTHPVIRSVRLDAARLAAPEAAALIRSELSAPASVSILATEGRMVLSGTADAAWYATATDATAIGGWPLDFGPLEEGLRGRFDELAGQPDGQEIMFERLVSIAEPSLVALDELARKLIEAQALAGVLRGELSIRLEGRTDGVGSPDKNRALALRRAGRVLDELRARGVDPATIEMQQGAWKEGGADPRHRKVVLRIIGVGNP